MSETVAVKGELGSSVIYGWVEDADVPKAEVDAFLAEYGVREHDYMAEEDFYQGTSFTRIIVRKSDGKLFGFTYWRGGGKYGEALVEANGDQFGFDDYDTYVFQEVESFTIKGYRVKGATP